MPPQIAKETTIPDTPAHAAAPQQRPPPGLPYPR
jgi:hypothetical protein